MSATYIKTQGVDKSEKVKAFWNARATLKDKAGTQDLITKWLEMRALTDLCHKYLGKKERRNVLDVGCGNGMTLIHIAKEMGIDGVGTDFAVGMIKEARKGWQKEIDGPLSSLTFQVNNVLQMEPSDFPYKFDLAYTERTLINLPDWKTQAKAIRNILNCVRKGGVFLMLENSQTGLDQINDWRGMVGLPKIEAPWHNRYLVDKEVRSLANKEVRSEAIGGKLVMGRRIAKLEDEIFYSSTYYFLSRIVNAHIASQEGEEPEYLSVVNKLAMDLPLLPGFLGQGRIWVWRKL